MSMDSYREGYELGQKDKGNIALTAIGAMVNIVRDDDFHRGYQDAVDGKDFDY